MTRVWFLSRGVPWKEVAVTDNLPPQWVVAVGLRKRGHSAPATPEPLRVRRFDRAVLHDGSPRPATVYVEWVGS